MDRVAQVQPKGVVNAADPRHRLPDAVGHRFTGPLDGLGGSMARPWLEPMRTSRQADQLGDVK
jgi:hypothetical protein